MIPINFKKIFCVMLSVCVFLPNGAIARNKDDSGEIKWNSENVKRIAKKVAPYAVGIGVPAVGAIVIASVLLAKNSHKSEQDKCDSDSAQDKNKSERKNVTNPDASEKSRTISVLPITREYINLCIEYGELPGIKFHIIKNKVIKDYFFYEITDKSLAEKYLAFINTGNKRNIFDWEMYIICQDKALITPGKNVSTVFGENTDLAGDINRVLEKIVSDANFELPKDKYEIKKDESKGGRERVIIKTAKDTSDMSVDSENVSDPSSVHADKRTNSASSSCVAAAPNAKLDKNAKSGNICKVSGELLSQIFESDAAVGDSYFEGARQIVNKDVEKAISNGQLPGFQFYRCTKSSMGTYHSYIVVNKQLAMQSLYITNENDEFWKKVLCYQNRWLYKDSIFSGWSFRKIFGFESGFGAKIDQLITRKSEKYEGRITFSEGSDEYTYASIGNAVFDRDDKRISDAAIVDDAALMSVITTKEFSRPEDVFSAYK